MKEQSLLIRAPQEKKGKCIWFTIDGRGKTAKYEKVVMKRIKRRKFRGIIGNKNIATMIRNMEISAQREYRKSGIGGGKMRSGMNLSCMEEEIWEQETSSQ